MEQEGEEPSNDFLQQAKNKAVPKLCEKRWSARVITLSGFISKCQAIYLGLKDTVPILMSERMPSHILSLWNPLLLL